MPSVTCLRARSLGFALAAVGALALGAAPVTVLALCFAAAAIPAAVALIGGVPRVRALCGLRHTEPQKER
ncbi:hypothetical protein [Dactylosporangium sp. CS-033363]|uniref:hypothetical protein n=1 Tax=Dactylosporangium sp. CS-033363 TaxID=3239935 RepID=UPI003D8FF06D